jgi:hypothetical protein
MTYFKGKVVVKPLEEIFVTHPLNVIEVLEKGENARHVGMTDWNEHSSRSHTVFTIVRKFVRFQVVLADFLSFFFLLSDDRIP